MEEFEQIPNGSELFAESLKRMPIERHPDFGKKKAEPRKTPGAQDKSRQRAGK